MRRGAFALVINCDKGITIEPLQGLADLAPGEKHSRAVGLEDAHTVVPVDDKSRQQIPFAVNQPVAIGLMLIQMQSLADLQRGGQTHVPEVGRQRLIRKAEHPHGDGALLEMTAAEQRAASGQDGHHLALVGFRAIDARHRPRENPGMLAPQGFVAAFAQDYLRHRLISYPRSLLYIIRQIQASVAAYSS